MMNYSNNPMHPLLSDDEQLQLLFQEDLRLNDLPTIPEFYTDQEIFVTGGTGFMGKVLVEKLLRSCPKIKAIYVLMRSKKGKSIEERLKIITDLPLFGPIRKMMPETLQKLVAISGDVLELRLGMSKSDIERIKNVSVVFHSAASVRFDDPLKYAVLMNTRGTREVMELALNFANLKAVVHVSTTYSNPDHKVVEEMLYPPAADWRKTIEICEKLDEDQLNVLTPLYINFMPNTYVFSKNLAEQVVSDYKAKLPVVVFRPSIVISTMMEPFPG